MEQFAIHCTKTCVILCDLTEAQQMPRDADVTRHRSRKHHKTTAAAAAAAAVYTVQERIIGTWFSVRPPRLESIQMHNKSLRWLLEETQLSLGWANCTAYIWRLASDFRSWKENNFSASTGMAALLYRTLQSTLYDTVFNGNLAHVRDWLQKHCI